MQPDCRERILVYVLRVCYCSLHEDTQFIVVQLQTVGACDHEENFDLTYYSIGVGF